MTRRVPDEMTEAGNLLYRTCSKCNVRKLGNYFYRDSFGTAGRALVCKACRALRAAEIRFERKADPYFVARHRWKGPNGNWFNRKLTELEKHKLVKQEIRDREAWVRLNPQHAEVELKIHRNKRQRQALERELAALGEPATLESVPQKGETE